MEIAIGIIVSAIAGYLVGCINPSYIIARLKGFDIRKLGSGNAGGSNAVITMGKTIGVFCCLFDIFKCFAVIVLMRDFFPDNPFAYAVTGVACILGHMFPFYMGFKGGKGLASFGGMMLAYDWKLFLLLFVIEVILVVVVNYICVAPITISIGYPIIYAVLSADIAGALIMGIATIAMLCKHIENIKRLKEGTELRFSYFWKKDKEAERARVTENAKKSGSKRVYF